MELGEKILQARREAGLSQRQLCGEEITRNMLSQIEHGSAKPSMKTLRYIAGVLGKPVSYFLDEQAVTSPNLQRMEQLRSAYVRRDYASALELLDTFVLPDPVLEPEYRLMRVLVLMEQAQAVPQEKTPYARQLLARAAEEEDRLLYRLPELRRRRLLLEGALEQERLWEICGELPSLDAELLLRAAAALTQQMPERAAQLLQAAQDRDSSRWQVLMGRACYGMGQYAAAAEHLRQGEEDFPEACLPLLEACFRELGDFRQAYLYACRQRK